MNTNRFRLAAAVAQVLVVLFASMAIPVSHQKAYAGASGLIEAGLTLDDGVTPDSEEAVVGQSPPGTIRFSFSGYGNPQRPFPGYVGEWQLGPVRIQGSGELRGSDGALLRGGQIIHTDNLRDRRYPNHSTTWQVIKGLGVQSAGGRTVLRLQVQVVSSNLTIICPVGTLGVLELVDDNRRMSNGQTGDWIRTEMPNPSSLAPDGALACRTHTHGMNNTDVSWTDPPRGGPPSGGIWAIVEISGGGACDPFDGVWNDTSYGTTITFQRNGNQVMGRYNFQGHNSSIRGTVSGNILEGEYFQPTYPDPKFRRGRLRFVLNPDGQSWVGRAWDANGGNEQAWNGTCAGSAGNSGGSGGRSSSIDLSGIWTCSDGGTYTIIHTSNRVVWEGKSGDSGRTWTHRFEGDIQGDRIVGYWKDLPPGVVRGQGSLSVRIVNNSRLEKVSSSVPFGGAVWTRAQTTQSKDCAECARQKCAPCRNAVILLCRANNAECEACMKRNGCL